MKMSHEELMTLLELVDLTRPVEIDCDEFLARVSGYLEELAARDELPPGYDDLLHHLRVCPECQEEFEALYEALCKDP